MEMKYIEPESMGKSDAETWNLRGGLTLDWTKGIYIGYMGGSVLSHLQLVTSAKPRD